MHLTKKINKLVSGLIVTTILFSSIPTYVFAQDSEDTDPSITSETSVLDASTEEAVTETTVTETEEPVDENIKNIPTDETTPTSDVTEDIEKPPIETSEETSTTTVETTQETTVETTQETTAEPTETTTVETTKPSENTESKIKIAESADEYFQMIADMPDGDRIIVDTTKPLECKVAYGVYYDGTYILGFDNETDRINAIQYLSDLKVEYALDGTMSVCGYTGTVPNGTLNPDAKVKVAIIDTGSNKANEAYSVIGDDVSDKNGHGTDMSNYILNETNNAYIISIKAIGDNGKGNISDVYAAVQMAEEMKVDYILMSISIRDSGKYDAFKSLIENANATIIASAGNNSLDSKKYLPAGLNNVITVGALNSDNTITTFSNYGDCVEYYVYADSTSTAAAIALGSIIDGRSSDLLTKPVDASDVSTKPNSQDLFKVNLVARYENEDWTVITNRHGQSSPMIGLRGKIRHSDYFINGTDYTSGYYCTWTYDHTDDDDQKWYTSDANSPDDEDILYCVDHDDTAPEEGDYVVPYSRQGTWNSILALCAFGPGNHETNAFAFRNWAKQWWRDNGDAVIADSKVNDYSMYVITHFCIDKVAHGKTYVSSDAPGPRSVYNSYISAVDSIWADGSFEYDGVIYNINKSSGWTDWYEEDEGDWQDFVRGGASATPVPCYLHLNKYISDSSLAGKTYSFIIYDDSVYDSLTSNSPRVVATGTAKVPAGAAANSYVPVIWLVQHSAYDVNPSTNTLTLIPSHSYSILELTTTAPNGSDLATPSGWKKGASHNYNPCFFYKIEAASAKSSVTFNLSITNTSTSQPKVKIQKSVQSGYTNITTGNSCYSLNNTTYKLYSSAANANAGTNALATFTCNASGNCSTTYDVTVGSTYYLKETSAGSGMGTDTRVHTIVINSVTSATIDGTNVTASNDIFTVNLTDIPDTDPISINLRKLDKDGKPVTGATMNGAVFRLYYYAQDLGTGAAPSQATCWYNITIDGTGNTRINLETLQGLTPGGGSNPNYLANLGTTANNEFPYGTIRLEEITAPSGYNRNTQVIRIRLLTDGSELITNEGTGQEVRNRWDHTVSGNNINLELDEAPQVGYYSLTKANNIGTISVAGYHFELYNVSAATPIKIAEGVSQTDGRVQWTYVYNGDDGNGYFSNDANRTKLTGTKTYSVELACGPASNRIQYQVRELDREITYAGIPYTVSTPTLNGNNMSRGTDYYYRNITVTNNAQVSHIVNNTYNTINLDVRKSDISSTQSRTYNFSLIYLGNGNTASTTNMKTVETFSITTTADGTGTKSFTNLPLGWYEVVETNGQSGWVVNYNPQRVGARSAGSKYTIDVVNSAPPSVSTVLVDSRTNNHIAALNTAVHLTDTISYSGLEAGTYVVTGVLVDRATGEEVKINGNSVTASTTFTIASSKNAYGFEKQHSGSTTITYNFDASQLANRRVVSYVELHKTSATGTVVAEHKVQTDNNQSVYIPSITTTLTDNQTKSHTAAYGNSITLTDTITYRNLMPNVQYTVSGVLMNKRTGAATNITVSKDFTPTSANGTVEVTYTVDRSQYDDIVLVAYEQVFYTQGGAHVIVAEHRAINDASQTVYLPKITTSLTGKITAAGHLESQGNSYNLTDVVTYSNLAPNTSYRLYGTIMVKETNKPLKNTSGTSVTTEVIFTSNASGNGTVNVNYNFNANITSGMTLVCYEYLTYRVGSNYVNVAMHENINDVDQTVYIPNITTTLYDRNLASARGSARNRTNVTLVDTVNYTNLVPGVEYTLEASLMVKETGAAFTNDGTTPLTATTTFTPSSANGSTTVTFTNIRTNLVEGKSLVCYETLKIGNVTLVVHNDINDVNQTVHIPTISTTLVSTITGNDIIPLADSATLRDNVKYTNLVPGQEYTVSGKLVYSDGSDTGITATRTFTPSSANGTVTVDFTANINSLAGKTVVAVEDLMIGTVVIASHYDLHDENQTVRIPSVSTTLVDSVTNDHITTVTTNVTLVDTVNYYNLKTNTNYTLVSSLVDKSTGNPIKDANGDDMVLTKTIRPTSTDGTETISFTVDATKYKGKSVVAYEVIMYGSHIIASHENLNDANQTVRIPDMKTTFYDRNLADDKDTALCSTDTTLVDIVEYTDLIPNKQYTLTATIMVKETNTALKNASGNPVTATKTFTPTSANGSVEVIFEHVNTLLAEGQTLVCFEDLEQNNVHLIIHADINDKDQTVQVPKIRTSLVSVDTNDSVVPTTGSITLRDTVTYTNLVVGKSYTLSGKLMFSDGTSANITATKTLVPSSKNGTTTLDFDIDASILKNKTLVAFEDLKIGSKTVATHSDLSDKKQTVYIPEISTTLIDNQTRDHVTEKKASVALTDTVTYKNLVPNKEYVMTGTLMNKATGEALKKANGQNITVEKTFTPTAANGAVEMTFTVDTTNLGNVTIVAFETLTYKDVTIAVHADINDVDQTVHVPDLGTNFYDKNLATDKDTARSLEDITLVDTVDYSNLIPGKEYTLVGTIMIKGTTPKALTNDSGNPVTVTKTFKPTTASGSIDIEFEHINAKSLEGQTLVAYETLKYGGVELVVHADINDEDQTVQLPKIRTTLISVDTNDHVVPSEGTIKLKDTVKYTNLIVGKTYTISGKLVFVDDGSDVPNGTGTTTFTAQTADGSIDVEFEIDASLFKNKTMVAYEDLKINSTIIATHADIKDADQTIYIPEIHTSMIDGDTKEHIAKQGEITLTDTVAFNNLIPGKEYTLTGTLIVKETGKFLVDADGNKITSTETWTPETASGYKDIIFKFDSSTVCDEDGTPLKGHTVVAYESLTYKNITIATHNDINDMDQSVDVPDVHTTLYDKEFMNTPAMRQLTRNFTKVTLVDIVYYDGITPNVEYTLYSSLWIKETGEPFCDAEGNPYTMTVKFTPTAKSGTVNVEYEIDATLAVNKHIVAYEAVDYKGVTLVTHTDINNFDQTVRVPEIGTTATDKVDGDKLLDGTKTQQTIVDTIKYTNLVVDQEYTATGKLAIKKDYAEGEEIEYVKGADGNDLVVSVKFKPTAENSTIDENGYASGTIDVEFTFDASKYAGKYLVAFETVDYQGIEVAVHADLNDETQTTKIPLILHVKIAKMDGKNVKYVLKNAEITLYQVELDAEGNPVVDEKGDIIYTIVKDINGKDCIGVTDTTGMVDFSIVYDEHYKYYAKETKAPRGYYLNDNYFEIIPDDTRESEGICLIPVQIVDFAIPPKTGDSTPVGLLGGISLIAVAVVTAGVIFILKKKSTNSDKTDKENSSNTEE